MTKIFFYGDSNTYGFDPSGWLHDRYPETVRWTGILKRELQPAWEVSADGMNGRQIPASPAAMDRMIQSVRRADPDVLFLMLGSNDILFSTPSGKEALLVSVSRKMHHLMNCLQRTPLRQDGEPRPRILLATPPSMQTGIPSFDEAAAELPGRYRDIANASGSCLVDTTAWDVPLGADGVHFSEEGHRAFAAHLLPLIRGLERSQEWNY